MKIRKGDTVKIISGNDRGKTGSVRAAFPDTSRIVVEGVNVKKKHVRARAPGQKGELVSLPLPFPVSRAMIVCGGCGKPTRPVLGREAGARYRRCRVCGKTL
jgi:large subunit ribosomal protein L24